MDIVIVGAGEVGYHLADILSREEHRVSVIDPDPEKTRRILEALDVQVIEGDGTRAEVLTQAGASKSDILVAVTQSDNVNMLVYAESSLYIENAIAREKEIKGWRRSKKIALILELNPEWDDLSLNWQLIGS